MVVLTVADALEGRAGRVPVAAGETDDVPHRPVDLDDLRRVVAGDLVEAIDVLGHEQATLPFELDERLVAVDTPVSGNGTGNAIFFIVNFFTKTTSFPYPSDRRAAARSDDVIEHRAGPGGVAVRGFGAPSWVSGTVEHSESRRRRGRWSWIVVSALAVVTVAATAVQGLSVPEGGTAKAGAAVTPLPTASQPRGGRIPPAGSSTKSTTKSSGSATNGGVHSDGVEAGGCESWGTDYVGVTYIHHAGLHGTWSANASGGVFAEKAGQVPFYGSLNTETYCPDFPVDSITGTGDSGGYWLGTQRGAVYGFGDAGSAGFGPQAISQEQ